VTADGAAGIDGKLFRSCGEIVAGPSVVGPR
jgi:hypothetical protein